MSRKVKSMRGEEVDFDLFDIKNKIMSTPKTDAVKRRERFIDKKRRRSTSRKVDEMLAQQKQENAIARQVAEEAGHLAEPSSDTTAADRKAGRRKIVKAETTESNGDNT